MTKREPVWYVHVVGSALIAIAAIAANVIGSVPADANWVIVAGIVVRTALAQLLRGNVFAPQTLANAVTRAGVPVVNVRHLLDDVDNYLQRVRQLPPKSTGPVDTAS